METRIIIAGSGGQGILFLGRMIISAGMLEEKEATWFPSYGAEMRGGTANCTVILSDRMIGSPVVLKPDVLIVLNRASLDRFLPILRKKGILLYDSSLITGRIAAKAFTAVPIPATEIAGAMGSTKSANMVMLGAFIAVTKLVSEESLLSMLGDSANPRKAAAFELNRALLRKGVECIENT